MCVACHGLACHPHVSSFTFPNFTFTGTGITADSFLEARGEDPCLCCVGWLTEFASYSCRTDILCSCWSSAERNSHFLEASTFLKMCPLLRLQATRGGLSPTGFTSSLLLLLSHIPNPGEKGPPLLRNSVLRLGLPGNPEYIPHFKDGTLHHIYRIPFAMQSTVFTHHRGKGMDISGVHYLPAMVSPGTASSTGTEGTVDESSVSMTGILNLAWSIHTQMESPHLLPTMPCCCTVAPNCGSPVPALQNQVATHAFAFFSFY